MIHLYIQLAETLLSGGLGESDPIRLDEIKERPLVLVNKFLEKDESSKKCF